MSTNDEAMAFMRAGPIRRWGWLWLPKGYPMPLRRAGWILFGAILAAEYRVWLALPRGVFSEYRGYTLSRLWRWLRGGGPL
jgi:hypothetical protein